MDDINGNINIILHNKTEEKHNKKKKKQWLRTYRMKT